MISLSTMFIQNGINPKMQWTKFERPTWDLVSLVISFERYSSSCIGRVCSNTTNEFWKWHPNLYEPQHDKANKMTCALSEPSDQPGYPFSLTRVFTFRMKKAKDFTHWAYSEDFDQTGWMPRLIWVFAGRTGHFVGFNMRRFIFILVGGVWFTFYLSF